jgi:uncharacterized cofD-like protein
MVDKENQAPNVVAIGGGTGLSTLLRGMKAHTPYITAIVTVADDGGSSGRLRRELGVLPPGDFRNCIAALADDEALITQLFQYRFGQGSGLDGHCFGNLFITALAAVTGSFERAVVEAGQVLAIRGRILPSTLDNVTLVADLRRAAPSGLLRVQGESSIPKAGQPIDRVFLRPDNARAYPAAVRAILNADLIVAGPGSLFTSILPNLLVDGIRQAVAASKALKLYVCNVATQAGETDGFDLGDHVSALEQHLGRGVFTHVLADDGSACPGADRTLEPVVPTYPGNASYQVIKVDVRDRAVPWRHDAARLSDEIMHLYHTQQTEMSVSKEIKE